MLVYVVALIVTLVPVIRFDLMQIDGGRKLWAYCELVMLILIAGLRYRVGGDTLIYMNMFEDYPTIGELSDFDFAEAKYNPFWYIYNSVFKTFGDSFVFFQIVQAIIVNVCFFRFFRRYSKFFFTCVFVYYFGYYCYFNMEIQREILCICMLLEAYPFLERRKLLPYFLMCAAATFMHIAAVVLFFFPLVLLVKKDNFWLALGVVAGMFVLLHFVNIIDILTDIAFEGHLAVSVKAYLAKDAPNAIGILVMMLITVPFLLLMYMRQYYGYKNDALMGALLLFLFVFQTMATVIGVSTRFSNYLMPFGIVFIVNTFLGNFWEIRKTMFSKLLISGVLFVYFFNLTYYYLKKQDDAVRGAQMYNVFVPYHSIFDPQEDKRREMFMQNRMADTF